MVRLLLAILIIPVLFAGGAGSAAAQLSRQVFERIAPAVAQVRARDCQDGHARSGTGFLFDNGSRLVTALHVVAGCARLDAYFERGGGRTVRASLDRLLDRVDLALLNLEDPAGTPLGASPRAPQANDELYVLAFFLGSPSMDNKSLKVTFGNTRLSSMLPAEVRQELTGSRAIDLNLDIVRLDGHLLPGASGAPLVDGQGRVVAIGSGGLRNGAASISWALPGSHLAGLLNSPARDAGKAVRTASLYAAPEPEAQDSGPVERIHCGDLAFVMTGTRSFAELAATTDDPLGLQQLFVHFQQFGLQPGVEAGFRFNIYTPEGRGAAVAIPDWMPPPSNQDVCRTRGADGAIEISFGGAHVNGPWDIQAASSVIELAMMRHPNWFPDPYFSYPVPTERPDGLVVRRKTFHGPSANPALSALAFETLASKGSQLFGIVAINHAHNAQGYQYCAIYGGDPRCRQLHAEIGRLAQAVFAVHLSTFPIY